MKPKPRSFTQVNCTPVALPREQHNRDPTPAERTSHFSALITAFHRVFNTSNTLREMAGGAMRIQLIVGAQPSAITASRPIPYSWRDEIKAQLDEFLEKDNIVKVEHPTQWCHPMVPVLKNNSGVRLCMDLTRLNRCLNAAHLPPPIT